MKSTVLAMSKIFEHLYKNRSNYFMLIGLLCILSYVYSNYGFQTSLLFVGVLLILTSLIVEINSLSNRRR